MHGRLKIKTTAEQQEEKRRERQKKLKIFRAALAKAFQKVLSNEYDKDGMIITKQILTANSDYFTFWNYRKKALKYFKSKRDNCDCKELWKNELLFIESCLRNNPKSYGCWHQRCFVMLEMAEPEWKKELHLTNLFLQLDGRNFHCWDYRRFLVKHSNHSPEKELEFTNTLIENNFSNYSSWHYRSKLLPTVYPDESDDERIADEKLIEELELVQNAFFTDPNDQSAWFYHRWLLGRGEVKQSFLSMIVEKSPFQVVCTLAKPVTMKFFDDVIVTADEIVQKGSWKPISTSRYSHSWLFTPSSIRSYISVKVNCNVGTEACACSVGPMESEDVYTTKVTDKSFCDSASDATLLCLEDELKSCQELNELEPGNKWVMLTIVLLMKAINRESYFSQIVSHLASLQSIDPKRSSYYADLASRYQVEALLVDSKFKGRRADFMNKSLTRLHHTEFLTTITYLDISYNQFTELGQPFANLLSLQTLKASQNKIRSFSGLQNLSALRDIDLSSNEISSQEEFLILCTCTSLQSVLLADNPLRFLVVDDQTKDYTFDVDLPITNVQ